MGLEFTSIIVVHHMKVSGKTIYNMVLVLRFGLIILNIRDSMSREVRMVSAPITGLTEVITKASGQ